MTVNKSIEAGASIILDYIKSIEAKGGYDVIFGNRQKYLTKQITSMTLDELIENQRGFSRGFVISGKQTTNNSSASGAYQFMRNTLLDLKTTLKLSGSELFTGELQDALGFALLMRRGYAKFMAGTMTREQFGNQLAMEWASFPVLSGSMKGAHRTVTRGMTYYAGDGQNVVLTKPASVEYILQAAKAAGRGVSGGPAPILETPTVTGPAPSPSVATVPHVAPPPVALPDRPVLPVPPRPAPPVAQPWTPPVAAPAPRPAGGLLGRLATWLRNAQS